MQNLISRYRHTLVGLCVTLMLAAGCTPMAVKKPATPVKPVKSRPAPVEPPAPEPVKKPEVAILLSNNSSVYRDVADELVKRLEGRGNVFVLSKARSSNDALMKQIGEKKYSQLVVLGLPAARASQAVDDKLILFSQIINYPEYKLVTKGMKGVDALPAVEPLFRDWHRLSPDMKKVLVLTGGNLGYYLVPAIKAAKKYGIELVHKEVKFDREYLYESKQLNDIQGQWIIPDNRVLSRQLLKDLLTYNTHAGRQTLVFNNSLLQYGGLMSVEPDPADIGRLLAIRLEQSIGQADVPGPDVFAVAHNRMELNPLVAKQLGLKIPKKFPASMFQPQVQDGKP